MAGIINGCAPTARRFSRTVATMVDRFEMPRLPTPTAMRAPGLMCARNFCNSAATVVGISTGGDWGKFCRTRSMRGNKVVISVSNGVNRPDALHRNKNYDQRQRMKDPSHEKYGRVTVVL